MYLPGSGATRFGGALLGAAKYAAVDWSRGADIAFLLSQVTG